MWRSIDRRSRLVQRAVAVTLACGAATLVLCILDEDRAADSISRLLTAGDPDLALASPFITARGIASAEALAALVLGILIVGRVRRILFALSAGWSLVVLGSIAATLAPTTGLMQSWRVEPIAVPLEALEVMLAVTAIACLVGSLIGWAVTPPRPSWSPWPRSASGW